VPVKADLDQLEMCEWEENVREDVESGVHSKEAGDTIYEGE